ncbi:T9SS C-terminal target domain-containing protein [bacterium]|nr:MAG: T9SS C-terminal target domain-containing protein [bacterium]
MKTRFFSILVIILLTCFSVKAQVVFTENFAYPAGDSIGAHGWTTFSGTVNPIMVVSPGLTYSGYQLSNIGNSARMSNNGNDYYKPTTGDSITSGSFYCACMVKIDTGKTGDYFMSFLPPTSTTLYTPRVFAKDSSGTISFGISKGAITTVPAVYGPNGFNYGTTYLLIVKYKFLTTSTTDDEVSLFIFTSPALPLTEPATPYVGPITSTTPDAGSIGRIALRQGSATLAPSLTIDGIMAGKSWSNIISGVKSINTIADNFNLSQNYPNPFNPVTNIQFSLPSNGYAKLKVYDILGKEVNYLLNSNMSAGTYTLQFDGSALGSGVYYYKLDFTSASGKLYSDIKKLTLIK